MVYNFTTAYNMPYSEYPSLLMGRGKKLRYAKGACCRARDHNGSNQHAFGSPSRQDKVNSEAGSTQHTDHTTIFPSPFLMAILRDPNQDNQQHIGI
jgi:hypothetical protein